ncbi:MAG TPA: baseplate J/gp47 family protein, partial [Polyangiaceae bacterium]|nr:baseplate J/gp47 family protein [Polyangiaceae bacterium]
SLGIVPALEAVGKDLPPGRAAGGGLAVFNFQLPKLPPGGLLPERTDDRNADYRTIKSVEVPTAPAVVELPLPGTVEQLGLWTNLDPLESGTRDFPPSLDGTEQGDRLITWIRLVPSVPAQASLLWTGINTVFVRQRARVRNEILPLGTGLPDQTVTLAQRPLLSGSVVVRVGTETWQEIDDLSVAGPEVPVPDLRQPPGTPPSTDPRVKVYSVDLESGQIRFGDGMRGARPARGATVRADYDYGRGGDGNVGPQAIDGGPGLPTSLKVTNVLPTWGGADSESVAVGEKQIPRFLQHRDRLVNAQDFESITLRTPGVAVGRVDVLSAYHPGLTPARPGNAPGAVTVLVLPKYGDPATPVVGPDTFLDAIACWLDPRRLVTTEVFVRRPDFQPIWVSIGLDLVAGHDAATVREAVGAALRTFLSPLPDPDAATLETLTPLSATAASTSESHGWPLWKSVVALEIAAVANRVPGVAFVRQALLADTAGGKYDQIPMVGLELPLLAGLAVSVGDATPISDLRGGGGSGQSGTGTLTIPVPIIPEGC